MRAPVVLAVLLGALAWPATASSAGPDAAATAFGVQVVSPGHQTAASVLVVGPPGGQASASGFIHPADASGVATGGIEVETRTRMSGEAGAFARARITSISLLGGEVRADEVVAQAGARAVPDEAGGTLADSSVSGLVVLGQPVSVAPNARAELGDWGYVVALEQAVSTDDGEPRAFRGFVVGLHVRLTQDHGGLPAGTEILVGYAEAAVQAGEPAPEGTQPVAEEPQPPAGEAAEPTEPPADQASDARPPQPAEPAPEPAPRLPADPTVGDPRRQGPPVVEPRLTGEGFVFPVYGSASFSNDYGAARASTGWHHGNDIFAALGAPVLAVTTGELFLVGWNTIGGNRLWLRDDDGNEYYYAHLSAFTPQAVDGVRVEAGDVLGFVGASGDAVGTPPHLHFEAHPRQLLGLGYDGVINPFAYLSAWQRVQDAEFVVPEASTLAGGALTTAVPPPGGVLLASVDISGASGLDTGALEQLLSFFDDRAEGSFSLLISPRRAELVGTSPGFSPR
ncbi:MAG: choice-of-anchor P family protein [Gaiellales bacterium]